MLLLFKKIFNPTADLNLKQQKDLYLLRHAITLTISFCLVLWINTLFHIPEYIFAFLSATLMVYFDIAKTLLQQLSDMMMATCIMVVFYFFSTVFAPSATVMTVYLFIVAGVLYGIGSYGPRLGLCGLLTLVLIAFGAHPGVTWYMGLYRCLALFIGTACAMTAVSFLTILPKVINIVEAFKDWLKQWGTLFNLPIIEQKKCIKKIKEVTQDLAQACQEPHPAVTLMLQDLIDSYDNFLLHVLSIEEKFNQTYFLPIMQNLSKLLQEALLKRDETLFFSVQEYLVEEILKLRAAHILQSLAMKERLNLAYVVVYFENMIKVFISMFELPEIKSWLSTGEISSHVMPLPQKVQHSISVKEKKKLDLKKHADALACGLRASVSVAISYGLFRFFHLPNGYWVLVSTALVLQVQTGMTYQRALQRFLGNLMSIAILMPICLMWYFFPLRLFWLPLGALILGLCFPYRYFFFSTLFVLMLIAIVAFSPPFYLQGYDQFSYAVQRVMDVSLGVLVPVGVTLILFPKNVAEDFVEGTAVAQAYIIQFLETLFLKTTEQDTSFILKDLRLSLWQQLEVNKEKLALIRFEILNVGTQKKFREQYQFQERVFVCFKKIDKAIPCDALSEKEKEIQGELERHLKQLVNLCESYLSDKQQRIQKEPFSIAEYMIKLSDLVEVKQLDFHRFTYYLTLAMFVDQLSAIRAGSSTAG